MASGVHGFPRQTNGIDFVGDFRDADVEELCSLLGPEFYADPETIGAALAANRPFNVIHLLGAFKFDFYPADEDGFARSELSRKRCVVSSIPGLESIEFPVLSPEDTILAKLVWFRNGGEVSDRQWHDILSIVKVQSARLDLDYLRHWAASLKVADLLARLFPAVS